MAPPSAQIASEPTGTPEAPTPLVSILLPHYQTRDLTLLCLRLIRGLTARDDYEVVVVDNGSTDDSPAALRSVRWIRLLRREPVAGERPAHGHGLALNLGATHAAGRYLLPMHTDTMVCRPDWLDYLLAEIAAGGPRCGGVGSWKMEAAGGLRDAGKWLERQVRRLRGRHRPPVRYLRSHCALYRREATACWPALFAPAPGRSAGEELHRAMAAAGWHSRFVSPEALGRHVVHLNHATMALNRHFGHADPYMPRTRRRAIRRIERFFDAIDAQAILADDTLDRLPPPGVAVPIPSASGRRWPKAG